MSKRRAYGQPLSGHHCGACGHGRKNALLVGAARLELAWVAPHDPKSCMYANSITRPQRPAAPYTASGTAVGDESGGPRRIRTFDLGIKSPLLCQLSYRPTRCRPHSIMHDYAMIMHGAPGGIRTPGLRIRSPLLLSAELQAQSACRSLWKAKGTVSGTATVWPEYGCDIIKKFWGERGDSNPQPLEPQSSALPLSYAHHHRWHARPDSNGRPAA